jgi:hypothetical protein
MDDAFGDALAGEAGTLLDQVMVLHEQGAVRPRRLRVLVVGDRCSAVGGEALT